MRHMQRKTRKGSGPLCFFGGWGGRRGKWGEFGETLCDSDTVSLGAVVGAWFALLCRGGVAEEASTGDVALACCDPVSQSGMLYAQRRSIYSKRIRLALRMKDVIGREGERFCSARWLKNSQRSTHRCMVSNNGPCCS